jgi:uncharacterized protein
MKPLLTILALLLTPLLLRADTQADSAWVMAHYTKREAYVTMRDGKRLFTAIYAPKDDEERHPILINRTPYSIQPYGEKFRGFWHQYWMGYLREGYIIVLQDVRGTYMSEGVFEDVRPYNTGKKRKDVDEASDTYDTIEWLLKNTKNNNGNVGVFGISYPGFYSTMAALSQHPALKATSPQAPVTDWFEGDDFHHNGAFMLMDAFSFYVNFGRPRPVPVTERAGKGFQYPIKDNYEFYLQAGGLKDIAQLVGDSVAFWKDLYAHPNNDAWWQARNTRNFVQYIPRHTATLVVGGLFDAEDAFGAQYLYRAIEQKATNDNKLVLGPWAHGYWSRSNGDYLGNVRFGSKTSEWYQKNIEIPYFNYHLKGKGNISDIKEANIFFTGSNEWKTFDAWPPQNMQATTLFIGQGGILSQQPATAATSFSSYTSNPAKPVPYTEDVHQRRTREYMTDDQRFAARRPDVLVFQTDVLQEEMVLAGPVVAKLFAAISTTDADFVVKLIDVFPNDFEYTDSIDGKGNGNAYPMGGYQMLVRGEVMRGRYRNSLEKPEAFKPNEITEVSYTLPDVAHTFKKGHRVMVQVQSSWFPLVDRNPQQFINIYNATAKDFISSDIRIYHDAGHRSGIILPVLR